MYDYVTYEGAFVGANVLYTDVTAMTYSGLPAVRARAGIRLADS